MANSARIVNPSVETTEKSPPLVLIAVSEMSPLVKTGGLGDVAGALPRALQKLGLKVAVVLPAYRTVPWGEIPFRDEGLSLSVPLPGQSERASVLTSSLNEEISLYFLRADQYFDRDFLYGTPAGDYPDNAERFAFFARAVLALAQEIGRPHLLHCHDWQTALVPVFRRLDAARYPHLASTGIVLTIHNLGYQGLFAAEKWRVLGLPEKYFSSAYLEFYGRINYLKGGIVCADTLTTVSRRYALEIQDSEYGYGLDGVLRERRGDLRGIINGADYDEWNPATDTWIRATYTAQDLSGKNLCKKDLQEIFHLPCDPRVPLLAMVTRLDQQKGLDLLQAILNDLLSLDVQFVLLGTGDQSLQDFFASLASRYPGRTGVRIAFDNPLAHKIEAGADLFLMPSKYEPCGLNQIYSLKYGTIPVVRATGGLDDTVAEYNPVTGQGTGFKFQRYAPEEFLAAIRRALHFYRQPSHWQKLMGNAMSCDFSWEKSAREYRALYREILARMP